MCFVQKRATLWPYDFFGLGHALLLPSRAIFRKLQGPFRLSLCAPQFSHHWCKGHGRRKEGRGAPGFWNFQLRKIVFLVSSRKNEISLLFPTPRKIVEKSHSAHPGKKSFRHHFKRAIFTCARGWNVLHWQELLSLDREELRYTKMLVKWHIIPRYSSWGKLLWSQPCAFRCWVLCELWLDFRV